MKDTVPNGDRNEALAGLAWYRPPSSRPTSKAKPKKTRARRTPIEKRWKDEPTVELRADGGPSRISLGGPDDDGSLHFLATGKPEPVS